MVLPFRLKVSKRTKVGRSKVWLHGRPADGETVAVAVKVHNYVVADLVAELVRGIGAG